MANVAKAGQAKYYPQTDLHVALMFLDTVHDSITLVVDRVDYFAYIKREVINVLGVPSWNEGNRMRYTQLGRSGKVINLVSANDHEYHDQLRGVPEAQVYRVEGWNVSDIRHNAYCACSEPDEEVGVYHGTDGRMHASVLCAECGKRIEGNRYLDMETGVSYRPGKDE